jgi:hypothetical protein
MSPVRQAAAATRRRAEAMGAGSGMSGADLSQLRQEQTSAIANAGERAALALDAADARKATAQEQEIEQRSAIAEERRAARQASLLAGVGQAAGVAGQLAGGVPEVLRAAGLAGAPINDTSALDDLLAQRGVTGEAANLIRKIPAANITRAMDDAEKYLETGDQQFLTEDAATILRAQQLSALQPGLSNMEVAAAIDDPLSIAPRGLSNQDITDLIK